MNSFTLGNHILYCADALTSGIAAPPGSTIVFDPPYDNLDCANARWDCASALVFTDPNHHLATIQKGWGLPLRWVFTWDTMNPLWVSSTQPLRQSKLCLWLGDGKYDQTGELYGEPPLPHRQNPRKGAAGEGGPWRNGYYHPDPRGRHLSTVYRKSKTASAGGHPHGKPEEWIRLLLANCCAEEEVVFDPFAGGGASLIAADALGKRWIGIESDPHWCEVIIARYEQRQAIPRYEQLLFEGIGT